MKCLIKLFPLTGEFSFINSELVEDAYSREMEREYHSNEPLIMGVDVARFGSDIVSSPRYLWKGITLAFLPCLKASTVLSLPKRATSTRQKMVHLSQSLINIKD
jgi:hypothetical protein